MSKVLPQDEGPNAAGAIDRPIMASAKVGHQHRRKVDSSSRKLHIRSGRSRIFYEMDRSKADRTLCGVRENKVGCLQAIKHSRKSFGTLLEHGESLSFLYLNKNCKRRTREL
jgi:hypothetical protein